MNPFIITPEELDALHGLPHPAQLIYLGELRPHMDIKTGTVGVMRRISWLGIAEAIETHAHQGIKAETFLKSKVRRQAAWLERAGLIVAINDPDHLVFKLPIAHAHFSVPKKADTKPTPTRHTQTDTPKTTSTPTASVSSINDAKKSRTTQKNRETPKADTHQESGIREDKSVVNNTVELALDRSVVHRIFDHWRNVLKHPHAKLDTKRQRAIASRLKEGYTEADIYQAIEGCANSAFHQGQNDRKQIYDDIELICRNASKLEQFMQKHVNNRHQNNDLQAWIEQMQQQQPIEGECHYVAG